jgi:DNA-binding MarR family transcriptional regulator
VSTAKTSDFDKILGAVTGQELTREELVEKTGLSATRLDALLNAMVAKKVILSGRKVGSGSRVFYAKVDKAGTKTQPQTRTPLDGKEVPNSSSSVGGTDETSAAASEPSLPEGPAPATTTEMPSSPIALGEATTPAPPKGAEVNPAVKPQDENIKITSKDISDTLSRIRAEPQSQSRLREGLSMPEEKLAMILRALSKQELLAQAGRDTNGERRYVLTKKGRRYLRGQNPEPLPFLEETKNAEGGGRSDNAKPATTPQSPIALDSKTETPTPAIVENKANPAMETVVGRTDHPNAQPQTDTGIPESRVPAPEIAPGTRIQLERTIGPERKEENPYEGDIKPEEVNPNVRHLDPRLLQPMELRITMDRGTDVRQGDTPPNAEDKARELLERAQRSKNKRAGSYGVEQTAKPDEPS